MGDLLAFKQYENASAPFDWQEYDYMWKSDRRYIDFLPSDAQNSSCQFPTFYGEDGSTLSNITDLTGCRASEFDQVRIKDLGCLSRFSNVLIFAVRRYQRCRGVPELADPVVQVCLRPRSAESLARIYRSRQDKCDVLHTNLDVRYRWVSDRQSTANNCRRHGRVLGVSKRMCT